jgi:hypothetical protein
MKANGMQQGEQLQLLLSLLPAAAETCLTSRAYGCSRIRIH